VAPCPPKARSADLSLVRAHSLTDRIMAYNRYEASPCRESSLILTWNIVFLPNAPRDVFLSIELDILPHHISGLHENW